MKQRWITAGLWLLAPAAAAAQERPDVTVPRWHFEQEFRMPDSLGSSWTMERPWTGDARTDGTLHVRPAVPMSSVAVVLREHLPVGTMILDNNTLRLGHHWILSNGQAENWAPWPAGYLDARTISLPVP